MEALLHHTDDFLENFQMAPAPPSFHFCWFHSFNFLNSCEFLLFGLIFQILLIFLAVPRQLYRWPCHWLTDYYTLLKNTIIQHSERLVTFETCDQSDEETWPGQQKENNKDKDNDNDKDNDKDKYI